MNQDAHFRKQEALLLIKETHLENLSRRSPSPERRGGQGVRTGTESGPEGDVESSRVFLLYARAVRAPILEIITPMEAAMQSLNEEDLKRLDSLLSMRFAKFSIQMIELAAFCLGGAMVLAIIVVTALRM